MVPFGLNRDLGEGRLQGTHLEGVVGALFWDLMVDFLGKFVSTSLTQIITLVPYSPQMGLNRELSLFSPNGAEKGPCWWGSAPPDPPVFLLKPN